MTLGASRLKLIVKLKRGRLTFVSRLLIGELFISDRPQVAGEPKRFHQTRNTLGDVFRRSGFLHQRLQFRKQLEFPLVSFLLVLDKPTEDIALSFEIVVFMCLDKALSYFP
ncbi:MAG TPA: hypothetical protein VFQ90_10715 [Stellaceae bacterium]|nr:hypothetical protein [Stellaceae bacterium]